MAVTNLDHLGESAARAIRRRAARLLSRPVVTAFHSLYYGEGLQTWLNTWWLGHRVLKNPLDLWIYQEILHELKPDLIVETGTAEGGSALYLASICDLIGSGRVLTVDIEERAGRPVHERIRYLLGSSTDPEIVKLVEDEASTASTVLVILDSAHSARHVSAELDVYAPLVTPGSYMSVEDTNINGHPVSRSFGPGPMEAVEAFLERSSEFSSDCSREKFQFTFNPNGYLKRIGGDQLEKGASGN